MWKINQPDFIVSNYLINKTKSFMNILNTVEPTVDLSDILNSVNSKSLHWLFPFLIFTLPVQIWIVKFDCISFYTCILYIPIFDSLLWSVASIKTFNKYETASNNNIWGYLHQFSFFDYLGIQEIIQWQSLVWCMVTSQLVIFTSKKELLAILV